MNHSSSLIYPSALSVWVCWSFFLFVSCAEAECEDCDPNSEYCVIFGSDVAGESSTHRCHPLPAACLEAPACSCLVGVEIEAFNLPFCLESGGCEETANGLKVVCPGG